MLPKGATVHVLFDESTCSETSILFDVFNRIPTLY